MYAAVLRLGMTELEVILSPLLRGHPQHPTYPALCELGKVIQTLFLCRYLESESLCQKIHEGLKPILFEVAQNSWGQGG